MFDVRKPILYFVNISLCNLFSIGRNDPGSSSVIVLSFATEIGSNFIIGIRNNTDYEPSSFCQY